MVVNDNGVLSAIYIFSIKFIFNFLKPQGNSRFPLLSILVAMVTVSPKRQYLGMMLPTTPATTEPVCIPVLTLSVACVCSLAVNKPALKQEAQSSIPL